MPSKIQLVHRYLINYPKYRFIFSYKYILESYVQEGLEFENNCIVWKL